MRSLVKECAWCGRIVLIAPSATGGDDVVLDPALHRGGEWQLEGGEATHRAQLVPFLFGYALHECRGAAA